MSQLNVNKIKNRVGNSGPTIDGNTTVSGILTATSFAGDGSGLSNVVGVSQTANINTNTLVVSGVTTATNEIKVRSDDGTPGNIDLYCEVNDAHYVRVQAPPHAEYSGNVTAILPTQSGDILVGDTSSAITQNVNTSGIITAASFVGDVSANLVTTTTVVSNDGLFGGNVTIGGTLTYEDVTNVDSVGMVTARSGVDITAGGITVVGVSTFNDDIIGDNATNISGINSVTATTFYGDGSGLTGVSGGGGGTSVISSVNDGANGRLDTFGSGNFRVFTSSGTFDATGITSVRARVVGAGSKGCTAVVTLCKYIDNYKYATQTSGQWMCINYNSYTTVSGTGGGAGGGYAHKVFDTPEIPGPGVFNVQVGQPWNINCTPTVGTSCFGSGLTATGGVGTVGGTGTGGDVNSTGGSPSFFLTGGAAGSQLGPGDSANTPGVCCSCGNIVNVPANVDDAGTRTHWGVERFPFDIFTGSLGEAVQVEERSCVRCVIYSNTKSGCSGGSGGTLITTYNYCCDAIPSCNCIACGPLQRYVRNSQCCRCGPEYICLSSIIYDQCSSVAQPARCAGHGAGGSVSSTFVCSGGTQTSTHRSCYPGGIGGYGGGGGAAISVCYKCTAGSPCSGQPACCTFDDSCGEGGAGGPGIVIVEW